MFAFSCSEVKKATKEIALSHDWLPIILYTPFRLEMTMAHTSCIALHKKISCSFLNRRL